MQGGKDFLGAAGGGEAGFTSIQLFCTYKFKKKIYFANFLHFEPHKIIKVLFLIEILKFTFVDTFKQGCQSEFIFL